MTKSTLNQLLKLFIPSLKKLDGSEFPPRSVKEIVALVQHFFNHELKKDWSIFKDIEFEEARVVLDAQMKHLGRVGAAKPTRRAKVVSIELEDSLWEKGVLGQSNGRQLVDTLVYMIGLHCGLRACAEHRALVFGDQLQLVVENGVEKIIYTECVSKNRSFGIRHSNIEPKVVSVYKNTLHPERCLVQLYKVYVSHR